MALIGVTINDKTIAFIKQLGIKTLYIALDRDARRGAILAASRYAAFFDKIQVLNVQKDPKDCSKEELDKLLEGVV
jgi:hypothetical protein